MTLQSLANRRVVFVTGKGGVGKSTCAAAVALALSRAGQRVLLCELGARATASDILGVSQAGGKPVPIPDVPRLSAVHLQPSECLHQYLTEHLRVERLVRFALQNRVLARLWQAMPAVSEMALLDGILRYERATNGDGTPTYDVVVVDLPATGHALAMLGVPAGLLRIIRVGPLAQRARELEALLVDGRRSALVLVALPEGLVATESLEFAEQLGAQLALTPSHVWVNGVLPAVLNDGERALLSRLEASDMPGPGRSLVDALGRMAGGWSAQQQQLERLRGKLAAECVEITYSVERGMTLVRHVADHLTADGSLRGA